MVRAAIACKLLPPRQAMKNRLLNIVSVLIPPLLIFVVSAAEIIMRNLADFSGGIGKSVEPFMIAAAIYTAVGILLLCVSKAGRLRIFFFAYLLTAPAWYIFQIARDLLPISFLSLIIVSLALAIGLFMLRRTPLKPIRDSIVVFGTVLLVAKAFTISQIEQRALTDVTHTRTASEQTKNDLPNIYHIVLDEFQSDLFQLYLDDRLKSALGGFRFYPHAITPFGRTEVALASTFSGIEYAYNEPLYDYIARSFTQDSMITRLRSAGYQTSAVLRTSYHKFEFKAQILTSQFDTIYWQKRVQLERSTDDRSALLMAMWFYKHFPADLVSMIIGPTHFKQLRNGTLLPNDAPIRSLQSFRDFMEREAAQAGHGRYVFLHLMLPHFPEVLGADCQYQLGKLTLPREQARCAVGLIEEFIGKLKELGRFKASLILIHGDHGKWMYYRDGNLVPVEASIDDLDWNWGRSRPLVLFKPAGVSAENAPLVVSPRRIGLLDIAPTVLDSLNLSVTEKFSGRSLLATKFPSRPVRYYHMYDKDFKTVINGDLRRYSVTDKGIFFESDIAIPSVKK